MAALKEPLIPLTSLSVKGGSKAGFSRAAEVFTRQTHVVNRRVAAAIIWPLLSASATIPESADASTEDFSHHDIITEGSPPAENSDDSPHHDIDTTDDNSPHYDSDRLPAEAERLLCLRLGVDCPSAAAGSAAVACAGGDSGGAGRRLAVRKVVPRQTGAAAEWDLVVSDETSVAFVPLQTGSRLTPPFTYRLELQADTLCLLAPAAAADTPSARWLVEHALPKVARWTVDMAAPAAAPAEPSLRLIDTERYDQLYKQLKVKYAAEFVKIWPQHTDPAKFVHEDVAIASYLLLLWEADRRRLGRASKQSFVDIGCGNGLLVHILCSEGHPGYGIDIRSRGIWKLYPDTTKLQVGTVSPSADTTYPGSDWLIGNHSDELTPWIPVMAAATGPETCFFLLPCCPWDFYSKYQRADTRLSQYEEYLQYVGRLSERCGFVAEKDRLRIPSTRRRCVVGRRRTASVTADQLRELTAAGSVPFQPRAAVPAVRNCTQLPGDTAAAAVRQVALRLAGEDTDGAAVTGLSLPEVAALLGSDTLRLLRQQCGGLKTLLKNHASVFNVRGDRVTLQGADWLRADPSRPELAAALKTSLCWQHTNLPAGCPLPADQCRYAHGQPELRTRPPRSRPLAVG
ncbi:putative tRNA (uracil-O(2)-)-methyltransferase [Amphibalanus amphitrite]|uniref:tRNA (uracil-O(2)-)-methyltransferase n=1 Tax=Amphibalanus amphitrite TaxID=1232801 RepID=A0A6A4X1T6_AMPAM|nr:putative tRNA (uracil-O(2)-)-methyltransferase [Amphibalanus amphitrite]